MDFYESLFRMLSALAVVLGLMVLVVVIVRRLLGTRALAQISAPLVQVLGTAYLGPRKSIAVVAVAGELLIVGVTSTDLIPLGRVRDPKQGQQVPPSRAKDPSS